MPRRPKGWKVWVEPNGKNWRCRWRGIYGVGEYPFVRKADAAELCDKKKTAFQRRDTGLPPLKERASSARVSEWAAAYLEIRAKNPRKNTYRNDCDAIYQWRDWVIARHGDTDLDSLRETDVYLWKDWLYNEHEYSHATVRNRLAHFKPGIKWAKQRGMVAVNFAVDVEMPKPTYGGRVLTETEIKALYGVVPDEPRRAFVLLLNSGMRKGEVVSLRKSQIEQPADDHWRAHFEPDDTKNAKPKAVVLTNAAKAAIIEAMAASQTDKVFENLTKGVFDYWMRKIQVVLGEVRLHDLKHTFCTTWMRATGDLDGLRQMTGNSLSSLRIYYHLALKTPRGIDNFKGFAPMGPLNADAPTSVSIQKE